MNCCNLKPTPFLQFYYTMSCYTATFIPIFFRSMKELEKDMAMLRNGMKEVGREIEFYRTQTPVTGDRDVCE